MARKLPPLIALRAFEAVGRTGSIVAAAGELSVSQSVVSRHVANLEAFLQVELFVPQGRKIVLTEKGSAYLGQVSKAFDAIARATETVVPAQRKRLEIWCVPGVASRFLLPHLHTIEERMPGHDITLQPTLARPDLLKGQADIEIVYLFEAPQQAGLSWELIARPRVFPVTSPAMLDRHAPAIAAGDLSALPLIHEESTDQWELYLQALGTPPKAPLRGMRLWHAHLAIEAARLGQGVALGNELLVGEDIANGSLREVGASDVRLGGYYVIAAADRWGEADIVAVRGWLGELLGR